MPHTGFNDQCPYKTRRRRFMTKRHKRKGHAKVGTEIGVIQLLAGNVSSYQKL